MKEEFTKNLEDKKLVILLANDFSFDSRVLKEAKSAVKAGMKVYLLARKSRATEFKENKEGIEIIRVQTCLDKLWAKISPHGGQEVAGSQSAGAPKALVTYAAILNTWLLNREFVKVARKIKPDLIHANDSTTLSAGYALKNNGAKLVYDAHELYTEQLDRPNRFWQWYFRNLEKKLKLADGIFSVNQSILDELNKRYKLDAVPKDILYNAPFYQEIALEYHQKPKLLYLGHYMPGRGIEEIIELVNKMDLELDVYGRGFENLASERVKIHAPVKPEEVVSEASRYDIGILPYIGTNLNNLYSTPNKLFEYMMAGVAIAASDLPEIAKVVNKNKVGVLFNPTDPKDMAQKIGGILEDTQTLKEYRQNALMAAEEFCWEKQEEKLLAMYSNLMSNF